MTAVAKIESGFAQATHRVVYRLFQLRNTSSTNSAPGRFLIPATMPLRRYKVITEGILFEWVTRRSRP